MKAKLFLNRQIINDYSSITYVGVPTYLLKSGAASNGCGIFADENIKGDLYEHRYLISI